MKFKDYVIKLIRAYFVIFASIMISITILCQIFAPDKYFGLKDIYKYMIGALIGDLPSLLFYSSKEMSEKEMRIRIIIHLALLEALLLPFAYIMGWVAGTLNMVFLAVQIAVIDALVRFLLWMDDKKVTNRINEKLKSMKKELENEIED